VIRTWEVVSREPSERPVKPRGGGIRRLVGDGRGVGTFGVVGFERFGALGLVEWKIECAVSVEVAVE